MEQYIRTNDDGERVVSYELLDVAIDDAVELRRVI